MGHLNKINREYLSKNIQRVEVINEEGDFIGNIKEED